MAFQLSPGVAVTEEDRTTIIPSVATTAGALSGAFQWGPVEQVTTVDSEINLVSQFGKPNDTTAGYFFTAANFLSYGNNLKLVRAVNGGVARNAVSTPSGVVTGVTIETSNTFVTASNITVSFAAPPDSDGITAQGTAVLAPTGGIERVILSTAGFGYNTAPTVTVTGGNGANANLTASLGAGDIAAIYVTNSGNNYNSSSNVFIQNEGSTSASANLDVHYKLKDLYVVSGGTNYGPQANIQFSGNLVPGGVHATATLNISGNAITGFTITNNGNGYIDVPALTINRNDGNTGSDASVTANIGYGYINKITVLNPGLGGYFFIPTITINKNNALGGTSAAAQARIEAPIGTININDSGDSFNANPSITITPASVDVDFISSNAVAIAVVEYEVLNISITQAGLGYTTAPAVTITNGTLTVEGTTTVALSPPLIKNFDDYDNNYSSGGFAIGEFAAKYPGALGNSIKVSIADSVSYPTWIYRAQFDAAPAGSDYVETRGGSNDELHVIVIDATGEWTGTAGAVLEKYAFVSKASDAKNSDGSTNYYKNVINNQSAYIWVIDHPNAGTNWGTTSQNKAFANLTSNVTTTLSGGVSGDSLSVGNVATGYALFSNDELHDVSLIMMGPTTDVSTVNTAIGIAEARRDAIVFASPPYADVVNTTGVADPWFSPAGYNRGVIKNVVKLAYSPAKTDRDTLYKSGINPVVTFPGQGTLLFGDKTLLARPSAFDRINVRRLFIVLEKSIATASKFQLFEFNDAFTRGQFKNIVEPFLRDVQGRRGITDFRVVCDETNNTSAVIDRNEFVADIFIKPARAINFIQLNFIATRSGISFEEVGA